MYAVTFKRKRNNIRSRAVRAAASLLIICIALSAYTFAADCRGVRSKVLRLRIIANSDMLCDQEAKTAVRDRILSMSADIFSDCRDLEQAAEKARQMIGSFTEAAADVLRERGFDYGVSAGICREVFGTRSYGSVTLPAGEYTALRITLGEGGGHNWWCVMFPMLCVPSSGNGGADVFNSGERRVTELDGYDLRFKCAELFIKSE